MESSLKKTKVELDPLTDIDMLIMIEKVISRIICHAIHQEVNKYLKDYDKN